jgi:hypothetical protein
MYLTAGAAAGPVGLALNARSCPIRARLCPVRYVGPGQGHRWWGDARTGPSARRSGAEAAKRPPQIFGGMERSWRLRSPWLCAVRSLAGQRDAAYARFLIHRRDPRLARPSGTRPSPEVPDDHHDPIHRPRHHPAGLHRRRAARARRVPGRLPRPHQRGLHPGPAAVHRLVPRRSVALFAVRRADIETFARELEARGRALPP